VIYDTASTGLFVGASNATVRDVTLARNGLMGLGANYADALTIDDLLAVENNAEHFNTSPVSGGVKIAKSRGVTVSDSALLRNDGPGVWLDQSVYDVRITGSDLIENRGAALSSSCPRRSISSTTSSFGTRATASRSTTPAA